MTAESEQVWDTVVIGSGPAGYSAALQTAKEGLSTFVFQGFEMGGQLFLYRYHNGLIPDLDMSNYMKKES